MTKPGKAFENAVKEVFSAIESTQTNVRPAKVKAIDGNEREIDVLIEGSSQIFPQYENTSDKALILECKDYKNKVEIGKVDELLGKIEDIDMHRGVLVSKSGFTKGALNRAKRSGKIFLASVVNSQNSHIRTRIKIPIVIAARIVKPFLVVNSENRVYPSENKALDLIDNIMRTRLSNHSLPMERSFNTATTNWSNSQGELFHFDWIYKIFDKSYKKDFELNDGFGVVDITRGIYITNKAHSFSWSVSELEKDWEAVDIGRVQGIVNILDAVILINSATIKRNTN